MMMRATKSRLSWFCRDDDDMVAQISGRKYTLTEASKIRIESKDAVKKRGQPSPDRGRLRPLALSPC